MAYAAKTVNPEEGKIRIRFETLSKRMSKIDVDIIHKKTDAFSLQETRFTPDNGDMGCFLLNEIERLKTLDTAPAFKKLCYELGNYSQSLPELMHHQQRVIKLLIKYIKETPPNTLESAFSLISVLGRDLKEDINPHFHLLFGALVNATHSVAMSGGTTPNDCIPNPELTGKLFETIAYLLRSNMVTLVEQPDELSAYYGVLLGSSVEFVRKFAAKAFSMIFRKLSTSVFKAHMKKLMKSVALNFKSALNEDLSLLLIDEDYRNLEPAQSTNGVRRTKYLIEGLSQLFYYCFKGIRGQLHSKATKKLQLLYQLLFGAMGKTEEEIASHAVVTTTNGKDKKKKSVEQEEKKKQPDEVQILFTMKSYATIIYRVTNLLHRHIFWQSQGPLLDVNFDFIEEVFNRLELSSSSHQNLSFPMKNLLWEMGGKLFLMIVTAANGRAFKDDRVKQSVMKRVLDLTVTVMNWTKCCCGSTSKKQLVDEFQQHGNNISRKNLMVSYDVMIHVWLLYPQNMIFSAKCDEILQGCLHTMNPKPSILYFAEAFVHKLPGSIVGKCILPVLTKALVNLKSSIEYELWLKLVNQFLFIIKDFRENSDHLLQLSSAEDQEETSFFHSHQQLDDDEISDDEDEDGDDEDDVKMKFRDTTYSKSKGKKGHHDKQKHNKQKESREHQPQVTSSDVSISDKHLYAMDGLNTLLMTISSDLFKELKKIKFSKLQSKDGENELNITLVLQLSNVNWFCQCLPNSIFGTDHEKTLLASLMEVMNKKISTKDFETICGTYHDNKGNFHVTFHHLLQLFTTLSSKSLTQNEVRTSVIQWIQCLVGYLTKCPQSISITSAFSNLLQTFHSSISDSPQYFLSQLIGDKDDILESFTSSLGLSLATPSYWLRLYTTRILEFIQPPIDEVAQRNYRNAGHDIDDEAFQAVYGVAGLIMEILRTPIQLSHEREIIRRLEMLEVWCRGDKLPKSFLSIICGFSLGLFHVKFKSIWSYAIQILNTIAQSATSEEILWPMLSAALSKAQLPGEENLSLGALDEEGSDTVGFDIMISQSLATLAERDVGTEPILASSVRSIFFPIKFGRESRTLAVQPDSRTDEQTVCLMLFELLKKTPLITLKRSKTIVPTFISFLQHQYYRCFNGESEILPLTYLGLLRTEKSDSDVALLSNKFIRQRMEAFLGIFAAVTGPKQLYKHNLLFALYHELVCKPDTNVAKLAFECILTYKPIYVTPYKENIRHFFDDKMIRNELLTMRIDESVENAMDDETIVKDEHKPELFPLVIRILFGRLLAKPSNKKGDKDQNSAKRSAVLSFIAKMDGSYSKHILYLMIRGILLDNYIDLQNDQPDTSESKAVQDYLADGFSKVYHHIMDKNSKQEQTFSKVSWERFQGFLFLLQPVISILGFRLTQYVSVIEEILIQILTLSHTSREKSLEDLRTNAEEEQNNDEDQADDEEVDEDGEMDQHDHGVDEQVITAMKTAKHASAARTLVLLRFAELVEIFHTVHPFDQGCEKFFTITKPLLESLKTAVVGARKSPALLSVIFQLSSHMQTIHIVAKNDFVLRQTIQCISLSTTVPEIGKTIFSILGGILDYEHGTWMKPYAELMVQCFTKRFQGGSKATTYDPNANVELKLSDIVVSNIGGARMELQLLCRLAEEIFADKGIEISTLSASNLATLVLGLLRAYTNSRKVRIMEDWVTNILRIYKSLLWRIQDVSSHAAFFSRLFGPTAHSASLFNAPVVRQELVVVFQQLATHKSVRKSLKITLDVIHKLTKPDESIMESRDYGTFIPIVQELSKEDDNSTENAASWSKVLGPLSFAKSEIKRPVSSHIALCAAPAFELIRCMYDKELAVRAAAVPALKSLITCSVSWYQSKTERDWLNILTAIVIPALRKGIQSSTDTVKSGFLGVFAHLIKVSQSLDDNDGVISDSFHKDLGFLLNEDDPEQDFFENITHIQLHRRARAFMKMKVMLQQQFQANEQQEEQGDGQVSKKISVASFVHILLPLLFHYLTSDEFNKKLHQNLLQDVTQLIGAISLHLPWNHYLTLFKKTLKLLERTSESKEKMMQTVLCTILDNFHFDIAQSLRSAKNDAIVSELQEEEDEEENEADQEQGDQAPIVNVSDKVKEEVIDNDQGNNDRGLIEEVDERTIASVVVRTILPSVKYHLVKTVKDHHGDKTQTVQTNIALALTNLIKRLEPPAVKPQVRAHLFTNLVISIVGTLKSKDSDIRDAARHCLAKMVMILGMTTLKTVIYELQSILKEGYQKHVSLYTVKTLLGTVLENYSPPVSEEDFPSLDLDRWAAAATNPEELVALRPALPDFDLAIPQIMNSVLDDISEETKQDREAEGGIRTNVMREMKGSKFNEILELIARSLLFRPTYALTSLSDPAAVSSIHAVSTPLLHALHHFYDQNYFGNNSTEHFQTLSGRIAEGLQRVAIGLAKNPSVKDKELLLYLHATLQPFVVTMMNDYRRYKDAIGQISLAHAAPSGRSEKKKKRLKAAVQPGVGGSSSNLNAVLDENESDFELDLPSYLRGESSDEDENKFASERNQKKRVREENSIKRYKAAQWLPREWKNTPATAAPNSKEEAEKLERKAVIAERDRLAQEQFRVQDGASAPRLTGRNRYDRVKQQEMMNRSATSGIDKSTLIAIKYCLTLLHSSLKKGIFQQNDNEIQSMLLPFIPLLRSFLYVPGASEVVTLSVKCITSMLQWGIKIDEVMFNHLTNRILLLMLQSGKAMVTKDNDLCQACMQGLVVCFKRYNEQANSFDNNSNTKTGNNEQKQKKPEFPLSELKVRVLIEMMTVSMMEITSNYQHPAFQLIKEIINAKIVLPEIYDLVNSLTEQIVLSHRQGIRDMASSILVQFMLVYPMNKERFDSHVQICLRNVSYEYEEGRISALETLHLFIKTFPTPVIEEYANILFLPMTLKLVNEKSHKCREIVVKVLIALMKKLQSKDILTKFQDFSVKWLHSYLTYKEQVEKNLISPSQEVQAFHNALSLMKVGSQIISIFFQARPDIWNQRTEYIREVMKMIHESILCLLRSYKQSKTLSREDDEEMESKSHQNKSDIGSGHWNAFYHLLLLIDTLYLQIPSSADYAITHLTTNAKVALSVDADNKKSGKKHRAAASNEVGESSLMRVILHELVLFPHVWVRSVSLRVLESYFKRRPIGMRISPYEGSVNDSNYEEVLIEKNMLYHIGRRLAIILNQNMLPAPLEESTVNAAVYILRMMIAHPELDTFVAGSDKAITEEDNDLELAEGTDGMEELTKQDDKDEAEDNSMDVEETNEENRPEKKNRYMAMIKKNHKAQEEEEGDSEGEEDGVDDEEEDDEEDNSDGEGKEADASTSTKSVQDKRGLSWMMQRLRAVGADIRGNRRRHVLKVFHALVKIQSLESVSPYLPQILEVPIRIMLSKIITEDNPAEEQMQSMLKEQSTELLRHVESKMGAIEFMGIFSEIQRKVEKIKHDKKRRMKAEAVSNPALYAKKKLQKNLQKKLSKKRKTLQHMAIKGLKRRKSNEENQN